MAICKCGCGQDAGVYVKTRSQYGHVRGQPRRFAPGHNLRSHRPTPLPGKRHDRPLDDRARIWLEEWDFLGYGQVRFRHFHEKIGTDKDTWRHAFYKAAERGDPRAVKHWKDELDDLA
jgi:hypothetical protein